MKKIHHAIDNIEFGVTDMPAIQAFYESAFGWRFNDYGPEYALSRPTVTARLAASTPTGHRAPADHSSRSTQLTSTQRRRQ